MQGVINEFAQNIGAVGGGAKGPNFLTTNEEFKEFEEFKVLKTEIQYRWCKKYN